MNDGEMQRDSGNGYFPRRPLRGSYQDKKPNYSPSSSYNYSHGGHGPQGGGGGQHDRGGEQPRRRVDRYRREVFNIQDRVVKQNDIIIHLLKEIRDRLPAPAAGSVPAYEPEDTGSTSAIPSDADVSAGADEDKGDEQQ